ncbi:hypothetical protein RB195_023400 [Necator americanus]|uniref:Endonuclease/exonuclease/phosphatase domain-containing protein n=1 Tax=Necator americanus TaxID=51031 RepID=A0ABR1EJ10_NECAM
MAISTYNACRLASEAAIEDLMMQAKKIKYDVIGLTETRRRHPLNAVYETGEELFLGTCDSRGVGGVGVLVNTSVAKNIDAFEQLTTRIRRLRMRRCGPTPALTIFVAYAPTSSCEEEVEAFYMDLEKFCRKDHAFYKVIIGDFNAETGPRRTPEKPHIGTHCLQWNEQGKRLSEFTMTTMTNYTRKAESFKTNRRRLSHETVEPIRQRGAVRAAGNQELTSELAKLYREAIKEDLKERIAEVLAEADEAGKSIPYARRDFAIRKTRMSALRNSKGTTIAWGMDKIIYDFYSFFNSHVHFPPHHPREDGNVIPEVLSSSRSPACYNLGKKSYGTRSQQNTTRTPEELFASAHQHSGEALYMLPIGMQGP